MAFDEPVFERYALQAEQTSSQQHVVQGGIDLYAVGDALGMSRQDSQDAANYMKGMGWAEVEYGKEPPRLTLTIKGFKEIAKLRLPRWRRWLDSHPGFAGAIGGAVVSGVFGLLSKLLEWLLAAK
jgi:hypothetical protein